MRSEYCNWSEPNYVSSEEQARRDSTYYRCRIAQLEQELTTARERLVAAERLLARVENHRD